MSEDTNHNNYSQLLESLEEFFNTVISEFNITITQEEIQEEIFTLISTKLAKYFILKEIQIKTTEELVNRLTPKQFEDFFTSLSNELHIPSCSPWLSEGIKLKRKGCKIPLKEITMEVIMEKKYELLKEDTIEVKNGDTSQVLYRIKALKDFTIPFIKPPIKAGDLGGYIASEENLSHEAYCWVSDNAKVYDNAKVWGNATVYGNAQVYGNAEVWDNAKISGSAQVYENAGICDMSKVYDKARVFGDAEVFNNAKVFGKAKVYGHSKVYDKTKVYDNAEIYGIASVCDNAQIYGNAEVYGITKVCDNTSIYGNAKVYGLAEDAEIFLNDVEQQICVTDDQEVEFRSVHSPSTESVQLKSEDKEKLHARFKKTTREDIIKKIEECVLQNRESTYGKPEDNFKLIANFWNTYLDSKKTFTKKLDSKDVAIMMSLLKIARISTGEFNLDNYVDLAGYAICGGEVASESNKKKDNL